MLLPIGCSHCQGRLAMSTNGASCCSANWSNSPPAPNSRAMSARLTSTGLPKLNGKPVGRGLAAERHHLGPVLVVDPVQHLAVGDAFEPIGQAGQRVPDRCGQPGSGTCELVRLHPDLAGLRRCRRHPARRQGQIDLVRRLQGTVERVPVRRPRRPPPGPAPRIGPRRAGRAAGWARLRAPARCCITVPACSCTWTSAWPRHCSAGGIAGRLGQTRFRRPSPAAAGSTARAAPPAAAAPRRRRRGCRAGGSPGRARPAASDRSCRRNRARASRGPGAPAPARPAPAAPAARRHARLSTACISGTIAGRKQLPEAATGEQRRDRRRERGAGRQRRTTPPPLARPLAAGRTAALGGALVGQRHIGPLAQRHPIDRRQRRADQVAVERRPGLGRRQLGQQRAPDGAARRRARPSSSG